ncbi:MAG: FHA domain-containing protein [candidate division KSB1 bacterium]|nr:FHA domain-containing protein [candidate division KSB1 bacterium]MDZ7274984.1 FHA domain-containing protein [candidate division KSB1 bacterium]MDZ7286565.1 FHA domain-containing protein [candidate division KSB1 bacterium]MDZ7299271.1 FHA domain-containing protein [candidate division KSB1 bacterium]MDZ7306069.1 FHA domain-containing protein [candidate division KSB1 bacterium]
MKARLFCTTGMLAGASFTIGKQAVIGKSGDNHIVLEPPVISDRHARIFWEETQHCYMLEDLGSRNGTQLDGRRVTSREKLGRLHVITFAGKFDFVFQMIEAAAPAPGNGFKVLAQKSAAAAPSTPAYGNGKTPKRRRRSSIGRTMIEAVPVMSGKLPFAAAAPEKTRIEAPLVHSRPTLVLEVQKAGGQVQNFPLSAGEHLVGRAPDCSVCIDDPSISRRHAVLVVKSDTVSVRDLNSRNHTFVGREAIARETEVVLPATLRFGTVAARLTAVPAADARLSGAGRRW